MSGTAAAAAGTAGTVLGVAQTVGSLGLGIWDLAQQGYWAGKNYESQNYWNEQNLNFQKEKLDYDKALQQQIFAREDNAVQRRVEDLNAAGLSPLLAAGSAANAGSVVPTTAQNAEAPQYDGSGVDSAVQGIQNGLASSAQLANDIFKAQSDRQVQIQTIENLKKQNALIDSQIQKTMMETLTGNYSLDYAKKRGIPLNSSPMERVIGEAIEYLKKKFGSSPNPSGNRFGDAEDIGKGAIKALGEYFGIPSAEDRAQQKAEKAQQKADEQARKQEEKLLEEQKKQQKNDKLKKLIEEMQKGTNVHAFTNKYDDWETFLQKEYGWTRSKY